MMSEENDQPIKKGSIEDNLTCPLCFNPFREATTVSACLHTFCKECIHSKFEEDNCNNKCPVCSTYLGVNPKGKLRCDNNWQNLKMMLLPLNNSKEPKRIPKTLVKKKKKSLSTLAPVQAQTVSKPRRGRPRSVAKKSGGWEVTRNPSHDINSDEATTDRMEVARKTCHDINANDSTSDQREVARKTCHDRNANGANTDLGLSSERFSRGSKNKKVSDDVKLDKVAETKVRPQKHVESTSNSKQENHWQQLTVLAETAKKTIDSKVATLGLPAFNIGNADIRVDKSTKNVRMKRKAREFKSAQNNNDLCFQNSGTEGEALQPSARAAEESLGAAVPSVSDLTSNESNDNSQKTPHPVWLALEGCSDRKGKTSGKPKKFYIKVKDGNMQVSYVQKYLKQKLNLKHESEVELLICGQTLVPEVTLNSLVDTWIFNLDDLVNFNSVENAMMVLTFRRKYSLGSL